MKTILKIAGAFILFIVLIQMCSDGSSDSTASNYSSDNDNPTSAAGASSGLSTADLKEMLESDRKLLADAKKNFVFEGDEFTGGGWYKHKLWDINKILHKTLLTANVNQDGYAYLVSNYYGDDWIFHESITVKIDDRVIDSDVVPTYEKNNVHENTGGSVWETIHFTEERDNRILSSIGANPEKTIKVRLNGRNYHKDYALSKNDKQAIADCAFLSELIKSVNDKEAQLKAAGAL